MIQDQDDRYFLQVATDEGNKTAAPRNFGACIVKDGKLITQGHNHVQELNDPSAHAEISTIRAAAKALGDYNFNGATMYASHEPCLMCFSCAAWANITRVVYAIPADEQTNFSYEFSGVSLQDLAKKLARRPISIELIRLS